jgi:Flp pilus assembly protein TadG
MTNSKCTTTRKYPRTRGSSGQSLIEFALVLPMLLVLVFGIVEFGNAWRHYQLITNTAREGARVAVLPSSTATIVESVIDDRLNGSGLDANQATVTLRILDFGDPSYSNSADTVTIEYPYSFVFLGPIIDLMCTGIGCSGGAYSSVTLSSTSIMRNE